ncbi:MAG: PAS domain S-box protein [Verrucomicrobia bacterium]|nr:PAS domain S-box protein [Verrucomicrobiota bacterium]
MSTGGQPLDDRARLDALVRAGLTGSAAEPGFDRLTRLAAKVVGAPVCLVSLVDDRRQLLKSAHGLTGAVADVRETPLTHSFCQHVVMSGAPLVVGNAHDHPLVCDNPAVREFGVVAYLGIPLRSPGGLVLGSFCLIDPQPRQWLPAEIELTKEFAALAETEIALRTAVAERDQVQVRQRAVLDGTTFGVISTTLEGVIELFNIGAERLLGYTAKEVVGRQTPAVFHLAEELRARAAELAARLGRTVEPGFEALVAQARQGRRDEREWTYVRRDGSRLPVTVSVTALRDQGGAVSGFLWVAQDLTEHKQAQTVLQAAEERLQRVLGHAECLVWEADVTLTTQDWDWRMTVHPSGLYRRLSGGDQVPRGAGLWYQFNIPEQDEMARRSRAAMESGAEGYEQEFRLVRNGHVEWMRESVSIRRVGPDRFWLVGVAVDITEQRRARAARDEMVARLNKLGSQVPGLIYQFRRRPDGTMGFPYASEGIRAIYGVEPEAVREDASGVFRVVHPDDLARLVESIEVSARNLAPWQLEYRTRTADGTVRWLLGSSLPEREADGSVLWHGFITDITERKQAEAALQATRTQLETTFAAMSEGLVLQDAQGAILECNAAAERILGLSRDQLAGRTSLDPHWRCVRPDGAPFDGAEHPAMVTLRTGEAQRDVVMGVHRADGSLSWVEINTELIGTVGDPSRQVVCSFRDITARRAAEDKVVQGQRMLATVTGILPGLVAYWTADLRCAFSNPEYCEWSGLPEEQMRGIRLEALPGPVLHRPDEPEIGAVLRGQPQHFERRFTRPDGRWMHTWVQYMPDFEADQTTVKGFVVLISDVTEIKHQEEALRASEAELARQKFALDQHGIVAITDVRGHFTYVNDRFCAVSRYGRDELLGRHIRLVDSGRHPAEFFAAMHGVIAGGGVWHGEVCNRAKDGSMYWVDTTVVPFTDDGGRPVSYVTISTDITSRKQLAVSLAQARDEALEASRLKSEFLATMSHEIRTPMNAVIGMAGLLADSDLQPKQAEMARTMLGGAETLMAIINDILDFSRIEAGRMRLDAADFDFRRLVEETVSLLAPRAQENGVELTLEFVSAPTAMLQGDGGRVRQVLTNLVGNAIKFTEVGEVAVTVRTTAKADHRSRVRVEVRDTGVGIAPEARARLFQPFTQADGSTTRRFGGTGLGLAICRQLVHLMGGEIGFESELGRGSVFWIELEFVGRSAVQAVAAATAPPGRRVLVVDDNETNRRILIGQLSHWGMEVEAVADAAGALARLRDAKSGPWHLVLLDWQMPGMSGLALAAEIQADAALARVPLVMLSSAGPVSDAGPAAPAGLAAFLTKPVTAQQLSRCLTRVLAGAGQPSPAPAPVPRPVAASQGRRGLLLLLVEDNPANQRVATMLLEKMGHTVVVAANGQIALEKLGAQEFDAVLMDCQMPVLDGYSATRQIRSGLLPGVNQWVPIIALTAYARTEDRVRCREAGMDDYVTKPIRAAELLAAVERCGSKSGRARAAVSAPDPAEQIFDEEALEDLRTLPGAAGPSLLAELIRPYLDEEDQRINQLQRLAERRANDELGDEAHRFGGNAATFGGIQVRRLALELERMARAGDWNMVDLRLAELRAACGRLRSEVARRRLVQP